MNTGMQKALAILADQAIQDILTKCTLGPTGAAMAALASDLL